MARRRQAVTIRHVAERAGVSLQTVSRVINKEPSVRAEVQARVQAAVAELGYTPSIAAQRMGGSRSRLILALNDRDRTLADWRERRGTDWIDQMLLGGMLACAEHGYRMLVELVDTHSDHVERELAGAIAALQPDGVILTPPHSQNPLILDLLERHGIATARIGSVTPGPGISLTMDDERGAKLATEHLLQLGHRRIGFVAGPDDYELSAWRIEGWRAAMARAGLAADDLLEVGDFSFESGLAAATALLDRAPPVTAIIASSDQMSLAAVQAARSRAMRVPGDLSIVSFDDTPFVRLAHPPLTAVSQPIAEVTARAVELIIAREGGTAPVTVPVSLAIRHSTAPPAAAA